jgi:hypothetical protein
MDLLSINAQRNGKCNATTLRTNNSIGLDCLKIIAAFTVVLIHAPNPWQASSQAFALSMLPSANALFALVAGMLMASLFSNTAEPGTWLRKRILRLVIPYLIWEAAYMLVNLLYDCLRTGTTGMYDANWRWWGSCLFFGSGSIHLWFVAMLFYAQCTVVLAWWVCRGFLRSSAFKLISLLVGVVACSFYRMLVEASAQRMYVFILGYLLIGVALARLPYASWLHYRIIARLLPVGLIFSLVIGAKVQMSAAQMQGVQFVTLLLWVTTACSLPANLPGRERITQWASCSMGIYLVHVFFTRLLLFGAPYTGNVICRPLFPIISALIAFAFSLSLVMATKKWRFLWGN